MQYIITKVLRMLYWNRWIAALMIVEITLGMSVFVYSSNLSYSLLKEEAERKVQERDLVLEISEGGDVYSNEQALTMQDYKYMQELTDDKTFLYIAIPQFCFVGEESYEFSLILADYNQLGLKMGYSYWGEGVCEIMDSEGNPIPELQGKQMPEELNKQRWKTEVEEIILQDCVMVPITYMEQLQGEITSGLIHAEWNSTELSDADVVSQEIEDYLHAAHGKQLRYRVYSPEMELKNNAYKVKVSIQALNKAGILILAVFFVGMLAIFQLLFEHRVAGYGIALACGANHRQLLKEIFLEIIVLNGLGTMLGLIIGSALTYFLDVGIMIGNIKVQADLRTFLISGVLCCVMSAIVLGIVYRSLKHRRIIELLNG